MNKPHITISGPPGCGKTQLLRFLQTILKETGYGNITITPEETGVLTLINKDVAISATFCVKQPGE